MIRELVGDDKVRRAAPLACDQIAEELARFRAALAGAAEPPFPATNHGDAMAP
ncbi:hypothetical protein [Bradyrhizobium sp. SZCCHNS3002]|uniref:hypothetical protein n=1 Tax=Bradyrhizobium sp. SZCCHNS3002 TaxID=3057310 RepID=UPI0028EBFBA7|nr:hypothetical protein [Bradyrhizobium sp. SZCCHNS3002]